MNTKLINTMASMLFMSLVGLCILIISALIKLPVAFESARFIALFIGLACIGCALYEYRNTCAQAKVLDTETETLENKVTNNSIDIEALKARTENIRKLLSNDQWFAERVDIAYFRRDEFGNRFMRGSIYAEGDITAAFDTMTIEEIRKAVGRKTIQIGDGTIEIDKEKKCFTFKDKEGKV